MIRTTITILTLTADTIIALATASPVLAASPSDEPVVTAETTVEAPDATHDRHRLWKHPLPHT
jgi:hypothetical protein